MLSEFECLFRNTLLFKCLVFGMLRGEVSHHWFWTILRQMSCLGKQLWVNYTQFMRRSVGIDLWFSSKIYQHHPTDGLGHFSNCNHFPIVCNPSNHQSLAKSPILFCTHKSESFFLSSLVFIPKKKKITSTWDIDVHYSAVAATSTGNNHQSLCTPMFHNWIKMCKSRAIIRK